MVILEQMMRGVAKKLVLGTFIIELECRSYNVYNFEIIKNYTYTFFLMVFILKLYLFMIY